MSTVIFFQNFSKLIIDEIVGVASSIENRVLAQHPKISRGFTDEELDFIINDDIQYRMGRDSGGDD